MKSKSKKKLNLIKWRQQTEFVNHWPATSRPQQYNGLIDKHNLYFFQLPTVQKHLKNLKKRVKKQQASTEKEALIEGLVRNRSIFGPERKTKSISKERKLTQQTESIVPFQRMIQSGRSLSTKKLQSIAEVLPRFSSDKKFPSLKSRGGSPQRMRTERQSSIEQFNVMQEIIKRRLGTTFQ